LGENVLDLAVIGGGINGCGIARDAAGRGLSVVLVEKGDLSGGTSSISTKLIHGGLRYLEHYEFGLVRESLQEREILLAMAPHLVSPLRFVLPHHRALRPAWMIRLGLFFYDHLGKRRILPPSRFLRLGEDEAGQPLQKSFTHAFEYSDCRVDDSRLVVLNALDAARRGARILVRTELISATREHGHWLLRLHDHLSDQAYSIKARTLVNSSGPWIGKVIDKTLGLTSRFHTRLVQGSHIVVPRLYPHHRAYIFQNADRRIIFAIPYEGDFTLIGTTDVDFQGSPDHVAITPQEISYLCQSANAYFTMRITPQDVVWSFSGVRPLYGTDHTSAQDITRDYELDIQGDKGMPLLVNVFGGKLTTYRHLAEDTLKQLGKRLGPLGDPWTRESHLPGGNLGAEGVEGLAVRLSAATPSLEISSAKRLARAYGTQTLEIFRGAKDARDLGEHFAAGLYQREVEYLVQSEWARTAEDILWRRSKLGLRIQPAQVRHLENWLKLNLPGLLAEAGANKTRAGG